MAEAEVRSPSAFVRSVSGPDAGLKAVTDRIVVMTGGPTAWPQPLDSTFAEIAELVASAKVRAVQAVNTALIDLYWQVGGIISRKIAAAEWGDGVVDQLADYLARTHPGLRGFTRMNLFRMRQFYEAWRDHELVSAVPIQLPEG